jgi:hypothetical protein
MVGLLRNPAGRRRAQQAPQEYGLFKFMIHIPFMKAILAI